MSSEITTSTDKELMLYEKKSTDLIEYYNRSSIEAEAYIHKTIGDLFISVDSLITEIQPTLQLVQDLRTGNLKTLQKIKIARKIESDMKATQQKYAALFQQINAHKADIVAALTFTVKDEYKNDMSKIIGLLIFSISNLTGGK